MPVRVPFSTHFTRSRVLCCYQRYVIALGHGAQVCQIIEQNLTRANAIALGEFRMPPERPKHIVLIHQFFWPDLAGGTLLATDLVRELARRGAKVTVIAGRSNTGGQTDGEPPDAEIIRVPGLPFSRNHVGRALSSVSFFVGVLACLPRIRKADCIITLTAPPLLPVLGTLLQIITHARHVIWEMDMYPDLAIDLGVLRAGSLAARFAGAAMDVSRRHAKCVISLGPCMTRRLLARGTPARKILLAENWADGQVYEPCHSYRVDETFTVVYAGNAGFAHDVGTIAGAMCQLKQDDRFRFVFVGGGVKMRELHDFCHSHHITGASFSEFKPPHQLVSEDYSRADVGLVTQNPATNGSIVPSKIYSLLGAGLPVVFVGPIDSTPSLTVRQYRCGWHVDCGRVDDLVALLRSLAEHPDMVADASACARETFLKHFELRVGVDRICRILGILSPANASPTIQSATLAGVPSPRLP